MPRYKPISKFPLEEFSLLFQKAFKKETQIEFASHYEAQLFRQQLYAFRRALKTENHSLFPLSEELSFAVDGHTLRIFNRKQLLAAPLSGDTQ